MAAVELGVYPFSNDSSTLMSDAGGIEEKVQTSYGIVKVSIYGNRKKQPILTFHDLGMDADNNFQNFFQFGTVAEFADKFCVYNINAPGQAMDDKPFPENYVFPTMDSMPSIIQSVVNHFGFQSFIGFGIGAGANALLRYTLANQEKVDALILINCSATSAGWIEWGYQKMNLKYLRSQKMTAFTIDYLMWHHFGKRMDESNPDIIRQYRSFFNNLPNPGNLAMFIESYLNRTAIHFSRDGSSGPKLNVPVLQLVGDRSGFIEDTVTVNTKLDPAKSDWVKVSDSCGLILDDKPEKATHSILLFLQGLGYFPAINVNTLIKRLEASQNGSMTTTTTICENINETEAAF
jgi:pimeloyl-ACP methyl ester carboxylesterase|uniref:Protein NDRG3 n=1 Tax=Panagrolaimus sp. PS1159 TaxID=55785 RepID=A0AC35G154_9BILA